MDSKTQQHIIVIAFGTLCLIAVFSFVSLAIYAIVHDGSTGQQFMVTIQNTLQWAIIAIGSVLGIHAAVSGGLFQAGNPPAAPTPPGGNA